MLGGIILISGKSGHLKGVYTTKPQSEEVLLETSFCSRGNQLNITS
jgi:hypothetical protein